MSAIYTPERRIEGVNYFDYSPIAVDIVNGKIAKIERLKTISKENEKKIISPGLVDIQINGYQNISFSLEGAAGYAGGDRLTADDVKNVTESLWKDGVTTYFPTLTTNDHKLLLKNFETLANAKDDPALLGSVPGFHLEGPYISPEDGYRGAHPKEHVRLPNWQEFLELYKASGEKILLITLAPEVDDAMDFIRKCVESGIVVSLGHHNGSAERIKQAIDNGARLATHLGNGCAPLINRHLNPIWPQLADDRIMASIICDGFHLPDDVIQVIYRSKGADNLIITSDITSYAGLPPGTYKIKNGQTIKKTPDGNLKFSGQEGGLYGSATPLFKAIGHVMKITGCSLAKAIQMATLNPAHLHKLSDRGQLEPGKRADLIVFTMENFNMKILKTIVAGNLVFQSDCIN